MKYEYLAACRTASDIHEHLPTFVDACLALDAKKVIELGTRGGVSTVAWLYGVEQTGGHVWSVDIDPAPPLTHERWTFTQGNDLDPDVFVSLPTADIVFIDTSHHYLQTIAELNLYVHKVRPGGRIFLHDTELAHPEGWTRLQPDYPVKTAVREFCADECLKWTNDPRCWGLATIQIPE
jgi:cephalosporin hydroxylase